MNSLRKQRGWITSSALALTLAASLTGTAQAGVKQSPDVQAAWKFYEISFPYTSHHTYYSCTGLESRLESILKDLGARKDVRVRASGCVHDVSGMLTARIKVNLPVAADADTPADQKPFVANSQTITLKSRTQGEVGAGDCELLEQVRDRLLPKLKMEVVKDNLSCIPGQATPANYSLQVAALVPAKEPA